MKMNRVEKLFVNGDRHSDRVAAQSEKRVGSINPKAGQRFLDVGCGNGAASIRLGHAYALDITGVDIDPDQVHAAAHAANGLSDARFLVADAIQLPLPDDEFDIVYTNKTTHHITDWRRAFAEMARVLKPGGQLIYSDFTAPLGQRLPTRQGIEQAAAASGLKLGRHTRSPFHYTGYFRKSAPAPTHEVSVSEHTSGAAVSTSSCSGQATARLDRAGR